MNLETFISNVGFPIAAYILIYFRLEKKIDKLTEAIQKLCLTMSKS